MSEPGKCETGPAESHWAEAALECPIRGRPARVSRFYHFFSRGCCSTYSYLYAALCDGEEVCRQEGVYDRCPLLKELMEPND